MADEQNRWQRTRSYFETRAQARWDERQREKDARREQMNAKEKLSEREEAELLRSNIQEAGKKYMESLRKSDVLEPGFEAEQRVEKVSALNNIYAQMMVQSCMRPLQRGVNAQVVVRAASMMAAMYMFSPNFRGALKEYAQPLKDAMQSRIDRKTEKKANWAQKHADKRNWLIEARNAKITEINAKREAEGKDPFPLQRTESAEDYLTRKWRKRYNDMQYRERGHREMFTERSAGMTEVALLENAYRKLREPGADKQQIMASYHDMVNRLYDMAEADGLDRAEVAKSAQVVLGERIQEDPRVRTMTDGLSHGWVKPSDPHYERMEGSDVRVKVWRGEFEDNFGNSFDQTRYEDPLNKLGVQGAFHLREPQTIQDHQGQMAQVMATTMADAIERQDFQKFNDDLGAYMIGYVAKANEVDGEGMHGDIPDRLMQSRTMLASMAADGYSERDQKFAYSNAYVDAIEALQEEYPDFAEQWEETYGKDWQDFMRTAVTDPQGAFRVWEAHQEASQYADQRRGGPTFEEPAAEPEPEYQA